jgi:hypothetical protein
MMGMAIWKKKLGSGRRLLAGLFSFLSKNAGRGGGSEFSKPLFKSRGILADLVMERP